MNDRRQIPCCPLTPSDLSPTPCLPPPPPPLLLYHSPAPGQSQPPCQIKTNHQSPEKMRRGVNNCQRETTAGVASHKLPILLTSVSDLSVIRLSIAMSSSDDSITEFNKSIIRCIQFFFIKIEKWF